MEVEADVADGLLCSTQREGVDSSMEKMMMLLTWDDLEMEIPEVVVETRGEDIEEAEIEIETKIDDTPTMTNTIGREMSATVEVSMEAPTESTTTTTAGVVRRVGRK